MNFRLEHHNKIFTILECLDFEILKKGSSYFGGGTLLALDFQEYRWSNDIDFLSSVSTGGYKYWFYRSLYVKNKKLFIL